MLQPTFWQKSNPKVLPRIRLIVGQRVLWRAHQNVQWLRPSLIKTSLISCRSAFASQSWHLSLKPAEWRDFRISQPSQYLQFQLHPERERLKISCWWKWSITLKLSQGRSSKLYQSDLRSWWRMPIKTGLLRGSNGYMRRSARSMSRTTWDKWIQSSNTGYLYSIVYSWFATVSHVTKLTKTSLVSRYSDRQWAFSIRSRHWTRSSI